LSCLFTFITMQGHILSLQSENIMKYGIRITGNVMITIENTMTTPLNRSFQWVIQIHGWAHNCTSNNLIWRTHNNTRKTVSLAKHTDTTAQLYGFSFRNQIKN
jgi:hypothetical protein